MLGEISEVSFNLGSSISNIFGSIFYLCNCGNIEVDVRNYSMFQNHLLHVQIIHSMCQAFDEVDTITSPIIASFHTINDHEVN